MSNITLTASVRQNLLSLQSIADMMATTQNRLATGKKVNTALDNPTNFFTAQGLDNRASDINNLLDGINNGVQVLQAANTGITSLQKLVDSAKSTANQALQAAIGYSTKSNVSTTISGATAADLRGSMTYQNAIASSNVLFSGNAGGVTPAILGSTLGGTASSVSSTSAVTAATLSDTAAAPGGTLYTGGSTTVATGATLINALTANSGGGTAPPTGPVAGDVITVDNKTITFVAAGSAAKDSNGNYTIGVDQTVDNLLDTIDTINGNTGLSSTVTTGQIVLHSGTNSDLTLGDRTGGTVLAKLGLSAGTTQITAGAAANITTATKLFNRVGATQTSAITDGTSLTVNGKTIMFRAADVPSAANVPTGSGVLGNIVTDGNGNSTIYLGTRTDMTYATVGDVMTAIDLASGVQYATIASGVATFSTNSGQTKSSITGGGLIQLNTSTGADLSVTGVADFLAHLHLTSSTGPGNATVTAARTMTAASLNTLIQDGSTLHVDGKTITFKNSGTPTASASHTGIVGNIETDGDGNSTVYLQKGTMSDVLTAIDLATGTQTATLSNSGATLSTANGSTNSTMSPSGALKISTGTVNDLIITGTGNALGALGLAGNQGTASSFKAVRSASPGNLDGKTLTFTSFNGGTAVNITFGDGSNGTVKTLADLNKALLADNMVASIDANGKLTISAGNDYASSTLGSLSAGGVMGGTATIALNWTTPTDPVADPTSQATRANLVSQYNTIMDQITKTAQDASYNGINLLFGDQLQLVFNETGKSKLDITGVTYDEAGLGLSDLVAGTDFIDNAATNRVLNVLSIAQNSLRSLASTFGSNLSIVQTRQDFSKNLINVLQTGSSNLTIADTNEEAANSQALSTRQSIAVSALSLANTAQQAVLQLLRS